MGFKDALEKKLESKLEEWKNEINEMKARSKKKQAEAEAEKADAVLQQEYYDRIERLQKASEQAKQKLDKLRQAGENSWESIKTDIENFLNEK